MKYNRTTFYCFSPPVMLVTIAIELTLLIHTLIRYKMSPLIRIATGLFALLATFQLAEYYVCGGLGLSAAMWSRIGFVAITLLPPLGLHLAHVIARRPPGYLLVLAYATGLGWALLFGASDWAFSGHVCAGNYVVFQLRDYLGWFYSAYYYGWLLTAIWFSLRAARRSDPKSRKALYALVIGYLVFMVPTATVNAINPGTLDGIPSIMCGFAVLFALILGLRILPITAARRNLRKR